MKENPVDSKKYDKNYYLNNCGGYKEFEDSSGKKLDKRLDKAFGKVGLNASDIVLDIGCGRGEIAFALAKKCNKVVAVDYSEDAIELAKKALKKQPKQIQKKITFRVMNAKKLNFKNKSFDKVIMFEVWEHIYSYEQKKVLEEIYRVLKKGGKAYIHTEPSRIINNILYPYWIYPVSSFLIDTWNTLLKKNYTKLPEPSMLRDEIAKELHVNEPSYFQILNLIHKSKFKEYKIETELEYLKPEISWKDKFFNFLTQLYPLSKYAPLRFIFANKFFITLEK